MPRGAKPKLYPAKMVVRVRALYGAGKTQTEIAEIIGSTQKVIWNLMRRHNIKSRVAACGNAVEPEIPELIGHAILEAMQERQAA